MLYRLAHTLRDRLPWIWALIGKLNSLLFGMRYGRRMNRIPMILEDFSSRYFPIVTDNKEKQYFRIELLDEKNIPALVQMFAEQPDAAFAYFKPHGFDKLTLSKLVKDRSFLAFVVLTAHTSQCVGYFFQRSFFWGKSFRGYMTDYRWQCRGINKMMNLCATEISALLSLRVFGTIAPENIASMKSARAANDVRIIELLENGDYYVEYLPKNSNLKHVTENTI